MCERDRQTNRQTLDSGTQKREREINEKTYRGITEEFRCAATGTERERERERKHSCHDIPDSRQQQHRVQPPRRDKHMRASGEPGDDAQLMQRERDSRTRHAAWHSCAGH